MEESFILEYLHPRFLVKRGGYYERGDAWFISLPNKDDKRYRLPARLERAIFII